MRRIAAFASAAVALAASAAASPAALDCTPGFEAIHAATLAQPGVIPEMTLDAEWNWSSANSVLDIFTLPNNPAHPVGVTTYTSPWNAAVRWLL